MTAGPDDPVYDRLRDLFVAAQTKDEFEFGCCLLRVRGMEAPGWDPYAETHELISELLALMNAPLVHKTQTRLALLLYSHLIELDSIYSLLANLLRVEQGDRYVIDPFRNPPNPRNDRPYPPSAARVHGWLCDDLRSVGREQIAEALESFFDKEIRNAFAHADYVITADAFRSRSAQFNVGGIITSELPLEKFVGRLNAAFRVVGAVLDLHTEMRRSYSRPVETTGRLGPHEERVPVRLLADAERGLYGFTTGVTAPPDAELGGEASDEQSA